MSADINTLFPSPKSISIDGQEFQIREFTAGEFPMVAALANRVSDFDLVGIGPLLENDSERLFALIASVTGKSVAEIKQLRISTLMDLTAAIIEENIDFFVRRLPAAVKRVAQATAGSIQSSASSVQATA